MSLSLVLAAFLEAAAQGAGGVPQTKPAETVAPAVVATAAAPKLSFTVFHINTNAIALTFDDGPHAKNTPRLLDMLKERGIKVTFFLIGRSIGSHPEIVRRMIAEGHEVANHTWDHKSLRTLSEKGISEELQKTHDAIVAACGVAPRLYRPPFGAITTKQMKTVQDQFKYTSILWEVDTNDWKSPRTVAKVHDTIMKDTHAGSIILCHDIHEPTIDAMPTTLDELKAKGFQFLTVSEMMKLEEDEVKGTKPPAPTTPVVPATAPAPTTPPAAPAKPAIGTTIPIEPKQPPPAK